jgi:hypothetical protein
MMIYLGLKIHKPEKQDLLCDGRRGNILPLVYIEVLIYLSQGLLRDMEHFALGLYRGNEGLDGLSA